MPTDLKLDKQIEGLNKSTFTGYATRVQTFVRDLFRSDRTPFGELAKAASADGIFPGQILWHAGETVPTGYIECKGQTLSRTE